MSTRVRIIADSIAPNGVRLTTALLKLWRPLLAEFNTHRALSRSAGSSRGIPFGVMLQRARFEPVHWPSEAKGMQGGAELTGAHLLKAKAGWAALQATAIAKASDMSLVGAHRSIVNRTLELFAEIDVVCSFTDEDDRSGIRNFLALRTERDANGVPYAERHFADVAEELLAALNASEPRSLHLGEWHLPFFDPQELLELGAEQRSLPPNAGLVRSVARCARTSFLKHDKTGATFEEDAMLFHRLRTSGHWGPFEHQGTPLPSAGQRSGNFAGWQQYRKTFADERRVCDRLERKQWRSMA